MLLFEVNGQKLTRKDKFEPATDSVEYLKAQFTFKSSDWNGKAKTALFRLGDVSYSVLLDGSGTCKVPAEVLVRSDSRYARIHGSKFHVSLVGTYGTTRITTNELETKLNTSGYADAETPADPTEGQYEQILTAYADAQTACDDAKAECQDNRNILANALKGKKTGEIVAADDVSPVEHCPVVKVKSKNHFNVANYSTETDHSNGKTIYAISADNLVIGRTYTVFSSVPMGWFKISNSATGYSCVGKEDYASGFNSYTFTYNRHANIPETWGLWIYINDTQKAALYDLDVLNSMNVCIVEGSHTTEYTPYIDPSTVTVTRCGKNLSKQSHITIKGTVSTNGSIGGFHGGILVRNMRVQPGATYVVSMLKPNEVTNPCVFFYNGNLSDASITHTACYVELVSGGRGEQVSALNGAVTNTNNYEYMAVTTGNESNYAENTETSISIRNLQIEVGEKATAFEPYNGTEYTPESDGTILGMTSLSPNMTILTDTEGAIVECEYNRDTNKVIEKLVNAVIALGGTV
jgi:hypothetical protein